MKCQTQEERNIEALWGTKELFRHFPVQVEELGQYDDYRSLHPCRLGTELLWTPLPAARAHASRHRILYPVCRTVQASIYSY